MSYITTKVQMLKSYPTYQFYATANSKTATVHEVFIICILEALRWIRARLQDFPELPDELNTPDPEMFDSFLDSSLTSFSCNIGSQIDVSYIDTVGSWSFRITEPDMGANIGTPQERTPVNGRAFTTEIAFREQNDCVEIGIRTICSEPSETKIGCEVFRPRLVKAFVENRNIRLQHSGFIIDGCPLEIETKADLERFFSIYSDVGRSLPIVLVTDSPTEIQEKSLVMEQSIDKSPLSSKLSWSEFSSPDIKPEISFGTNNISKKGKSILPEKKNKKEKTTFIETKKEPINIKTKLPTPDYRNLAKRLIGFAIVVYVNEKFFHQIENKSDFSVKHSEILIIPHNQVTERFSYSLNQDNPNDILHIVQHTVIDMQKRSSHFFGDVLFYFDAKLKEYRAKRHQTTSLEEKCKIYQLENKELKSKINELSQQQTDLQQISESLRIAQKKLELLSCELEESKEAYQKLKRDTEQRESAYRKSAELIQFYQFQIGVAALFPVNKDGVCDWIEEQFSNEIIVASRARSEMRKYSGSLDLISLCDGIVYLDAYVRFRRQEISKDELALYAQRKNWEIQGCGKEAMKLHRSDYTVQIDGISYLLDQHIKHGVRAEELVRIYFCWDDDHEKVIIGSMPEHLATVKNST